MCELQLPSSMYIVFNGGQVWLLQSFMTIRMCKTLTSRLFVTVISLAITQKQPMTHVTQISSGQYNKTPPVCINIEEQCPCVLSCSLNISQSLFRGHSKLHTILSIWHNMQEVQIWNTNPVVDNGVASCTSND